MLAALHPRRVRRLILFAPANPYSRSSDPLVRLYSSSVGRDVGLACCPIFRHRFSVSRWAGCMAAPHRVAEASLREIAKCLRNPGTLRHVLCIIRCWFAEEAKLKARCAA